MDDVTVGSKLQFNSEQRLLEELSKDTQNKVLKQKGTVFSVQDDIITVWYGNKPIDEVTEADLLSDDMIAIDLEGYAEGFVLTE